MICSREKRTPYIMRGCTDSNPVPSDRLYNAFPTKPAASQDAYNCDDLIGPYWDIYKTDKAGQQRLAKGQGSARLQISQA